ncbi:hypothetical protein AAVH_24347 [Aphelenchoides avenae]|nr:hypothetical protein AAVH_24347 [Aphelenchus avenae]
MFAKKEDPDGQLVSSTVVNVKEEPSDDDDATLSDDEDQNTPTKSSLLSSDRRYNLRKRTTNVSHYDSQEATNDSDDGESDDYEVVSDEEDENVSAARPYPKRYKCAHCDFRAIGPYAVKEHSRIHTGVRPFACSKCHKRFRTKKLLSSHETTHATVKRHKCDKCNFSSKGRPAMLYHQRKTHGGGDLYKCTYEGCSYSHVKPSRVKSHMLRHTRRATGEAPFRCKICGQGCVTKGELRKHITVHADSMLFKCKECQYASRTREPLRKHVVKCHSGGVEQRVVKREPSVVEASAENAMSSADLPAQVPANVGAMEPTMDPSNVKGEWTEMESVVIDEGPRPLKAESPSIWDDDEEEHGSSTDKPTNQRKRKCPHWPKCGYTTSRPDYMKRHQAVHDDTQRSFTCDKCGKGFTTRHVLEVHMAVHSDEKPFACDDCDCRYKRRHELATHRRKHTGELLKCPQCDFTTWKDGRMSKHKALKHREEKPFACGKCDRRFVLASLLWRHERDNCYMNSAKGYACSQCDYVAKAAGSLTVHVRKCHPTSADAK